mmetsp:Transcript_57989/g.125947  ORF Transcript_57989/g.125947 Transcript_57989/m.125947 type:complete len:253 (-) Transcript_57989:1244-2002(-)
MSYESNETTITPARVPNSRKTARPPLADASARVVQEGNSRRWYRGCSGLQKAEPRRSGHTLLEVLVGRTAPPAPHATEARVKRPPLLRGEQLAAVQRVQVGHVDYLDGLRLALELLHGFNVCVRRERQCGHRAQHARRRARVREERVLTDRGRWVEGSYLEVVVERAVTYREDESVGAAKGAARVAAGERVPRLVVPAHDAWQHEDPAERVRECEGRADLTKLEVDQLNVARGAHAAGRVEEPFRHVRYVGK